MSNPNCPEDLVGEGLNEENDLGEVGEKPKLWYEKTVDACVGHGSGRRFDGPKP